MNNENKIVVQLKYKHIICRVIHCIQNSTEILSKTHISLYIYRYICSRLFAFNLLVLLYKCMLCTHISYTDQPVYTNTIESYHLEMHTPRPYIQRQTQHRRAIYIYIYAFKLWCMVTARATGLLFQHPVCESFKFHNFPIL